MHTWHVVYRWQWRATLAVASLHFCSSSDKLKQWRCLCRLFEHVFATLHWWLVCTHDGFCFPAFWNCFVISSLAHKCLWTFITVSESLIILGGSYKTSQISTLVKTHVVAYAKLHYTYFYLSHQWRHWEILDEVCTFLKSVCQKVTFHQSNCTIRDPDSRKSWRYVSEFLGVEDLSFSLICRKQKLTRTVTLICWRLPYCLNVIYFTRAVTSSSCKTQCSITPCKSGTTVSMTKHSRLHSCWWMGIISSYSPDLNPLDYCIWDILQDLMYEGRRLPFANLQNLKEAIKYIWKEVTNQTVWKSIAQWNKKLSYR